MDHIRNLVFSGGGVKGIAYAGVAKALEAMGILKDCHRFAGASAGSIGAWLMAYYKDDASEIERIQRATNFSTFTDDDWGFIRDTSRLLNRFGWYKGDKFYRWAKGITKKRFGKNHITFDELYQATGNDLVVAGCNLSKGRTVYFSRQTTPSLYVERALRISMSIPLFFRAVFLSDDSVKKDGSIVGNPGVDKEIDVDRDVFVDGGVLDNYPLRTFDREPYLDDDIGNGSGAAVVNVEGRTYNKRTIGFRLGVLPELEVGRINNDTDEAKTENLMGFVFGLVELIHHTANTRHLDEYDWHRTIQIDTAGVKGTEFDLSDKKQSLLIDNGKQATDAYVQAYSSEWKNYLEE